MTATEVRAFFGGISAMTLHRWLRDERMGFPRPLVVNRRRLFDEAAINEWASQRSAA